MLPETRTGRRGPAEPEIRNPKLEIRNKSKFTGMGQWTNGKPAKSPAFRPERRHIAGLP